MNSRSMAAASELNLHFLIGAKLVSVTLVIATLAFAASKLPAQVTLYDNLDNFRYDDDWLTANGPDRRFAQQFLTRDNATLDQVTVMLTRPRTGATGSLGFELWRDDGSNRPLPVDDPAAKIMDIGKVLDITEIPLRAFGEFTFDNLEFVLEANSRYWVVANYSEVTGFGAGFRSVGWVGNGDPPPGREVPPDFDATAGTMGAAHASIYRDANPSWGDLADFFDINDAFFAMSVEAMEAVDLVSVVGDFNENGELDSIDIDMLSSQIRNAPDDRSFDLNNDGVLSDADRISWVHDLANTYFGDSNLDGEFNSLDLIEVLVAGEYDDNITLNSTWAEGDWDGDGDFGTSDLVAALQDGGYDMGARAAVAAVPEPSGWILLTLGLIGMACRRTTKASWK